MKLLYRICLFFMGFLGIPTLLLAQDDVKKPEPAIRNVKVVSEVFDGKGNIIRTIQYNQGLMKITETVTMPIPKRLGYKVAINPDTMRKDSVLVLVKKSQYMVEVYYKKRMIRTYKAVFGPRPLDNKIMEGDRCTPEGWFKIVSKNPRSQYNKFMLLSYPNDSAIVRFNRLKALGKIPSSATIGSAIGIHGIWPGGDDMIDMGVGWTDGCVALRNIDVDELFTFVGVGSRVYIQK